jgi:16S rRNA (guanine527-N7)-methyltransferase
MGNARERMPSEGASPRTRVAREWKMPAFWRPELTELLGRTEAHGIQCEEGSLERLSEYCAEFARWSEHTNLVSRADVPRLVSKRVAASMSVLLVEPPKRNEPWIDVGSGAGLPGMIVKLCRPSLDMTLIDSSQKKTDFLEAVRESLGLRGLEVIRARVEQVGTAVEASSAAGPSRRFAVILMRAVVSLADSFDLIDGVARDGSRFLTFKGMSWERELENARKALDRFGWVFTGETKIPWTLGRVLKFTRK